jgi:hypothetical protein
MKRCWPALLLCAVSCVAATDTVVVLETNPGMEAWLARTVIPRLPPGDAMAIVTFGGKPRVRQQLTDNQEKLAGAIRKITIGNLHFGPAPRRSSAPVFAAVATAARLLGKNGGRIVLLFGSEEGSGAPTGAEVEKTLTAAHIRLDAVAVRRSFPLAPSKTQAQTPPTLPGRAAVSSESLPLPEATIGILQGICRATAGRALKGEWDLAALLSP